MLLHLNDRDIPFEKGESYGKIIARAMPDTKALGILVGGVISELAGYSAAFWTVAAVNATGVALFFLRTRRFFLERNLNEGVR